MSLAVVQQAHMDATTAVEPVVVGDEKNSGFQVHSRQSHCEHLGNLRTMGHRAENPATWADFGCGLGG